ncbi:uncharacterized protein MELLADRAFT_101585 [Melampsora larici-populina 98AG31]|uniref:Uncharacterized protein n=1 Tax=Melampsora larici-populina (strain 98AG31 / pathotype 3-4-7) TaxID=747676 RepID=F4R6B5_MELLP|nr:uncharacterized protein MELLADRAFT_101585 [Melampsora larici-populina 98AG31]EGG12491.1 hypothetical protein MELLADRAFT_101585 [Melampsora larici-populina 98AG31]
MRVSQGARGEICSSAVDQSSRSITGSTPAKASLNVLNWSRIKESMRESNRDYKVYNRCFKSGKVLSRVELPCNEQYLHRVGKLNPILWWYGDADVGALKRPEWKLKKNLKQIDQEKGEGIDSGVNMDYFDDLGLNFICDEEGEKVKVRFEVVLGTGEQGFWSYQSYVQSSQYVPCKVLDTDRKTCVKRDEVKAAIMLVKKQ